MCLCFCQFESEHLRVRVCMCVVCVPVHSHTFGCASLWPGLRVFHEDYVWGRSVSMHVCVWCLGVLSEYLGTSVCVAMRECEQMCFACPAVCLQVWVWASVCEGWCTCDLGGSSRNCVWPRGGALSSGREPGCPGSPLPPSPAPPHRDAVLNTRTLPRAPPPTPISLSPGGGQENS